MADRGPDPTLVLGDLAALLDPEATAENPNPGLDRQAVNAALKVLFDGVVVDYMTGRLRFRWRQGGESSIVWVDSEDSNPLVE